jgi:hypothetical protein
MSTPSRSDEAKFEPDPKDGSAPREPLTDEQLAAIAAGGDAAPRAAAMAEPRAAELERAKMVREHGRRML